MLSLALEGANLGTWDWDLTTGKATWSERIYRMLGYTPNEFAPDLKNWKRLVHQDDWPRVSETLNLHLEGKLPNFEVIYRAPNKSGGWQWLQAQGTVTEFDADRKPIRITGVVADITERKRAEEALRVERERFQMLSDRAPFGMVMIAKDGTFEYVNPKFTEIFGYDLSDVPNGTEWFRKAYPEHAYRHKTIAAWKEDLEGLAPGGTTI